MTARKLFTSLALITGLLSGSHGSEFGLVSHWAGENDALDSFGSNHGALQPGTSFTTAVVGSGFFFPGSTDNGVAVADSESLKITRSLGISMWARLDNLSNRDFQMMLFRGDNRGGFDPYWLGIDRVGNLIFSVTNEQDQRVFISAPFPMSQYVFVEASLDDTTGLMQLYFNHQLVAQTTTHVRPLRNLTGQYPGLGIGCHSGWPDSAFRLPYTGVLDEVKLYSSSMFERNPVTATSYDLQRGTLESGDLASLVDPDDSYFVVRNGLVFGGSESPITLMLYGNSPVMSPNGFSFVVKGKVTAAGLQQRIDLFDFETEEWVNLDTRAASKTETMVVVQGSNPQRFVDQDTGQIAARIRIRQTGPVESAAWRLLLNQAVWRIF